MGKITQILKSRGIQLDPETLSEISALDKRLSDLEQHYRDHQAVEQEYASLKDPPPKRKPREPYNPEQGTGAPPPQVILRKPGTRR